MQSIIKRLMLTSMAVMAMAGAWAQASAPAAPEAVTNLNKFNGIWQANITSNMGDKTYQFDYTVKCMPIAGGMGAYWEESGTDPTMGDMRASDLFGYNAVDGKLHCYTVDNMGSTRDQICEWKSPDHLYLEYHGIKDGKPIIDRMDLTFKGDDQLGFTMTSMLDGKQQWSGSGTFHKVEK